MDELISRILQMDEEARKLDEQAQEEKIASHAEVMKKRQEVYEEYLESAKAHVEAYKTSETKASENSWKKTAKYYDDVSRALDKKFRDNKSKWVDEIVNGVLSYNSY